MVFSNKMQMVFCHDSSIVVSNSQQPPVTLSHQSLIKFIDLNIT